MTKSKLLNWAFFFIALVVFLVIFGTWKPGVSGRIFWGAAAAMLVGFTAWATVAETRRIRKRSQAATELLSAGRVEEFLRETDRDIAASDQARVRRLFMVNKSAGLFYQGEFSAGIELLKSVPFKKIPRALRPLYVNNLLNCLMLADRLPEANALREKHAALLARPTRHPRLNLAIRGTLAYLDLMNGRLGAARAAFQELLLAEVQPLFSRAIMHYALGQIELEEGNAEAAGEQLRRAMELGQGSFIPARAEAILAGITGPSSGGR